MYRRPKFLTVLHKIREAMSREADYDVDLFAEMVRAGAQPTRGPRRNIRGFIKHAPANEETQFDEETQLDEPEIRERRRANT